MIGICQINILGRIVKQVRIFGLMALISYMIVVLFTWIYANMQGFIYFSAGIPEPEIKYIVWVLGFLGFIVAIDYLHQVKHETKICICYKNIQIIGFMSLISYMINIFCSWITANMHGFIYFSAGEPNLFIKYLEWVLGVLGIIVAIERLHKECNDRGIRASDKK